MRMSNYCGHISGLAEVQPVENRTIDAVKNPLGEKKIPLDDEIFIWGRTEKPWEIEILVFSVCMS